MLKVPNSTQITSNPILGILFPILGIQVDLQGIIKIKHVACDYAAVTFVAQPKPETNAEFLRSKPDQLQWLTLQEYQQLEGHDASDLAILQDLPNTYVAPLDVITSEMVAFK